MTDKRDYYEVLEVGKDATDADLKKAYRRLAMKYHPDQNPDDESAAEKFKELTEAYQVLADADKRARYDRFGHQAYPGTSGTPGFDFDMDLGSMTDFFESIFGSMFGGGGPRRRHRGRPGRDLQYDLTLTIEQVVAGADLKITIPRPVRCDDCGGSGAAKGTAPETCHQCGGRGQIRLQQGIFAMNTTCNVCNGKGTIVTAPCSNCSGAGLVEKEEEFEFQVPPGVDEGAVKVIHGGGEHGRDGAPNGDLNIMIRVEKHKEFERRGDDLVSVTTVTYPQAVLGSEVTVKTIDGSVKMKIKPGTRSGQIYVLRGKGIPHLRGSGKGDQKVQVDVDIPKELSPRQRELIAELGEELGTTVQAHAPSFVDKVKSLFE